MSATTLASPTNMTASKLEILTDQPIATWFNLGGKAARMAKPRNADELRGCLELDPTLRILGDGANLLIADEGVKELVVSLSEGDFGTFTIGAIDARGYANVRAGAGVHLFKLINATVEAGLTGLENLAGIPACVGGAVVMNAGGKFGSTSDYIASVEVIDRQGQAHTLKRAQIEFTYRHSSLTRAGHIVTAAEFRLRRAEGGPAGVKAKLKEVTEFKKSTQPMNANSAGCCFKNPTLSDHVREIGTSGTRVSAGMLIDKAGCKGLRSGGAAVSDQHANFIVAEKGCTAGDVITLMRLVREKVQAAFKVTLEPEVVVWGASV